jgi:molybdenum cofactor cytidylyltransferase
VTTAAVVLAAGGSSRFVGGHKLLAPFRGRPLVTWAVQHAVDAELDETMVVGGAVELRGELVWLGCSVTYLRNPAWASGIASSLQCAINWARAAGHDAVVVGLGDQPLVPALAWQAVAASAAPLAVANYAGRRSHPVRLACTTWPFLPTSGDNGARSLMASHPELVAKIPCRGDGADVDTAEDLAHLNT